MAIWRLAAMVVDARKHHNTPAVIGRLLKRLQGMMDAFIFSN
jgi:hypothetical protein